MSSRNNSQLAHRNSKLTFIALLIAVGMILFIFESLIPRPLPWLKLGFAHISTLLALYSIDEKSAFVVVVLRVILGSFILGTFLNPSFFISITAGIIATSAMILLKIFFQKIFSIYGISITGAVTHNFTQLIVANFLIIKKSEIFFLFPVMALTGVFTGFLIAFVSHLTMSSMKRVENL